MLHQLLLWTRLRVELRGRRQQGQGSSSQQFDGNESTWPVHRSSAPVTADAPLQIRRPLDSGGPWCGELFQQAQDAGALLRIGYVDLERYVEVAEIRRGCFALHSGIP